MVPDTKLVPCKDCTDRHPACHDECEKYKTFKQIHDSKREAIYKYKNRHSEFYGYRQDSYFKTMKTIKK